MAAKAFSGRTDKAVQTGKEAAPQQPRVRLGMDDLTTPYHVPDGPRQSRRGDPLLDCVHRKLPFTSSGPTADVARDPEEEWRVQIWRCYGTLEVQPPAPFGLRWAPATIFSSQEPTGAGPMSPEEGALVTWGPDSPEEPLETDTVPEVPGWPHFTANGRFLRRGSPRWRARWRAWRRERFRSSPLRALSHRRVGPSRAPCSTVPLQEVRLPSPPASGHSALLRLRRELARINYPEHLRRKGRSRGTARARPALETVIPDIELLAPDDPL